MTQHRCAFAPQARILAQVIRPEIVASGVKYVRSASTDVPIVMKQALCSGLVMLCVSAWARDPSSLERSLAAKSAACIDFAGVWEVCRQPAMFHERITLTQVGCAVTIYDNDSVGFSRYAHYHAKGNILECDRPVHVTNGVAGPGAYCSEIWIDNPSVKDNDGRLLKDSEYGSWPVKITYHETASHPLCGKPSLTGSGTSEGMGLQRLYKSDFCQTPSTHCYRHWTGEWTDGNKNFTLTQEGCNVTRKYWMSFASPYEVAENYTACGDHLLGLDGAAGELVTHPDGPFVLSDQNTARYVQCSSTDGCTFVWSRRSPDPPKPELPTCLPNGGHPIAFADGMKPPCCDNTSTLVQTDYSSGRTYHNIWDSFASWEMCGRWKCLSASELCTKHPSDCCEGLTCVSSGPMYGSYCTVKRSTEQPEVIRS